MKFPLFQLPALKLASNQQHPTSDDDLLSLSCLSVSDQLSQDKSSEKWQCGFSCLFSYLLRMCIVADINWIGFFANKKYELHLEELFLVFYSKICKNLLLYEIIRFKLKHGLAFLSRPSGLFTVHAFLIFYGHAQFFTNFWISSGNILLKFASRWIFRKLDTFPLHRSITAWVIRQEKTTLTLTN